MTYYEWTDEKKVVNGVEVYRIRATKDMQSKYLKKGALGGFMCKKSVLEDSAWVSGEAVVIDSRLYGDISVQNEAVVESSNLKGHCHIQNGARLYKVVGAGLFVVGEPVIRNTIFNMKKLHRFGFHVEGNAIVEKTFLTFTEEVSRVLVIKDSAQLWDCTIEGSQMEFSNRSILKNCEISGVDIQIVNCPKLDSVGIKGNAIKLLNVTRIHRSFLDGKNMRIQSGVDISESNLQLSNLEMHGMEVVVKNCEIKGNWVSIDECVYMQYVDIVGENVKLRGYASLIGLSNNRLELLRNVEIADMVKIHLAPGQKANAIANETMTGDLLVTTLEPLF